MKAASTLFAVFGGGTGTAYLISDHFLHPSWMKREPGALREISAGRAEKYFMGKARNPHCDYGKEYHALHFAGEEEDRAWYIPHDTSSDSTTCVIAVHGAGNDRRELLKLVGDIQRTTGSNMMLFDCGHHGKHPGTSGISMGAREHEDVILAVQEARKLGNTKICLLGTSQGAASAVLAAERLGTDVNGLVLENSFACQAEVVRVTLDKAFGRQTSSAQGEVANSVKHSLSNPIMSALFSAREYVPSWYLRAVARVVLFRMGVEEHHAPIAIIANVNVPILFMHGTEDDLVPLDHTLRLSEAAKRNGTRVEEWYPVATHSMLYNTYPDDFIQKVSSFVNSI